MMRFKLPERTTLSLVAMMSMMGTTLVAAAPAIASSAPPAPTSSAVKPVESTAVEAPDGVMADGCNNYICIEAGANSATTGMVRARFRSGCLQNVHFHFWGPGFDFHTPNRTECVLQPTQWYGPFRLGKYCVEGWLKDFTTGGYQSIGLPCVTI